MYKINSPNCQIQPELHNLLQIWPKEHGEIFVFAKKTLFSVSGLQCHSVITSDLVMTILKVQSNKQSSQKTGSFKWSIKTVRFWSHNRGRVSSVTGFLHQTVYGRQEVGRLQGNLDLKRLNHHVSWPHFKMETTHSQSHNIYSGL